MNNTALAIIQPDELEVIQRTGRLLANSGYFDGKGDTPQAIAMMATKILAGREMGFGPFASVNGINIIQGKPAMGANLMAAAIKSSGRYDYRVREMTDKVCRIEYFERVDGKWESIGESSFTDVDARKAGTKNMDKFARNMLFARAMSNGVRWYCPDIMCGNAVYVPEELGAEVDGEGNVVTVEPRRVEPTTGEIVDADVDGDALFEKPQDPELLKLLDHLNALGEELYGGQWPQVRKRNVVRVSGGKTDDSLRLSAEQIQLLINGMMQVKSKREQQPVAEAA